MQRLKQWLEETETVQKSLAKQCGVSQATISDWVTGAITPTVANLRKLSAITGMSIDQLLSSEVVDTSRVE